MSFYKKNLQALSKKNPQLVAYLNSISTNNRFEVFMDDEDDVNINIYDRNNDYVFYQNKPVDDVVKKYENIMSKKSRYPFIVMYGIGNGLLVKMLSNLDKFIVVVEPELELIYIALNLFDFSKQIEENKFKIFYSSIIKFVDIVSYLKNPDLKVFLKTYDLEINNEYYIKYFSSDIIRINKIFVDAISNVVNSDGNSAEDSLIGFNHHLKHIPQMISSFTLKSAIEQAKNISKTAVIVSTGPSLAKQLPLLKKYQDYLTILCIDASLPILQKEGIRPDFVFSMERVEATAKFFENLDEELLKDTIFMLTSISHPKTLQNLKNMKKCISMRPFGYTNMFRLEKWGYLGIGMSAANMAFDFAFLAKFENTIFIGQDLAFSDDGRTHSKGAVYGEVEEQYNAQKILEIPGYYGGLVKTTHIWKLFLDFFLFSMRDFKEHKLNVYNSTEGGAYIEGAKHKAFKDVLESLDLVKKSKVTLDIVNDEKQLYYLKRSKKLIELYIERLKCIKKKIDKTFLDVMEKIENLEKLNKDEDLEKIDFDELADTISKIDEIKDILETDRALAKFVNITNPIILSAELELAKIMVRESNTEIEKKSKMIDWIYEHKSWLFFLSAAIENIIFIFEDNYKDIYSKY